MAGKRLSKPFVPKRPRSLSEMREGDVSLGGWNADATTSDRPMGDFEEVFNMRKMRPGSLEVRTGYDQYQFPNPVDPADPTHPSVLHPKIPLWKAEYRLDTVFVDVTFYSVDGRLKALIFNPSTTLNRVVDICACGTDPRVCAYQFQTHLIVSMLARELADPQDAAVYALSPAANDTTLNLAWTVTPVGKEVTPAPASFAFSDTITGKLFAFIPQNVTTVAFSRSTLGTTFDIELGGYEVSLNSATGNTEFTVVPLDIKAPYFLSTSNNYLERMWEFNKTDVPVAESETGAKHVKSRGWWCRAVLRRKFKDARGQDHVVSEAPSADWYVEDRSYSPPVMLRNDQPYQFPVGVIQQISDSGNFGPRWIKSSLTGPQTSKKLPSQAQYDLLRQHFIDFNGGQYVTDSNSPLFFLAASLGAAGQNTPVAVWFSTTAAQDIVHSDLGAAHDPYRLANTSYQVSQAPNAIYTWANFGLNPAIDTTIYAIDIYRTAYSYPNEKDNGIGDPLWGTPYNYGYVGTLHSGDATFTDNIADANLLFDQSPLDAEGYLVGEFAGEVMRPYQDMLVLGNTRTKYRVRSPWSGIQAFAYLVPNTQAGYPIGAINNDAADPNYVTGDGLFTVSFSYAYVDRDGNISDAVPIFLDNTFEGSSTNMLQNVIFNFPRGYSDSIVSARLIRSVWSGGIRTYYNEVTVPLASGVYISTGPSTGLKVDLDKEGTTTLASLGTTLPAHNIVKSDDPGYIIWSKVNNAWEWPQENIENEHDQNPVTALDEVIGPLYVFSDKGIVMTRLNGYREPVHTSGTGVGCISRFACVKVDKVVFALSASGLIYVEGSGVVEFSAGIATEVRKRLQEDISAHPTLYGVREQASLSYLPHRKELWLTFPSTIGRGGELPQRTFVIKFLDGKVYAYEFEIAKPNPAGRVIHLPHADGSMWSAFYYPGDINNPDPNLDPNLRYPSMKIQNNDSPKSGAGYDWPGEWACQYQHGMGSPNVSKRVFQLNFLAGSMSQFYMTPGMVRTDGQYNRSQGTLLGTTREVRNLDVGTLQTSQVEAYEIPTSEYRLPISGSVVETTGTPPGIRLYGRPDAYGSNRFLIESFDLYFAPLHQHHGTVS